MSNELGKTLSEILESRYTIPLYQRNFAWRIEEVHQLLQDIYDAFEKNKDGNYYIGSLVVLKRRTGEYEVIDGQQRLTVLSMLVILLGTIKLSVLSYDSRPEVQAYFDALCNNVDGALQMPPASLFYLKEAYIYMREAKVVMSKGASTGVFVEIGGISDFVMNHVVLVRNEIPEDTDVALYFEIMNNRGEQLQKHELVKAKMLDRIKQNGRYDLAAQKRFAKIWDACSQMGTPIQRMFSCKDRKAFFGDEYDGFVFNAESSTDCVEGDGRDDRLSIDDILKTSGHDGSTGIAQSGENDDRETDTYQYDSIIDFPNFLMHVLRLYVRIYPNGLDCENDVPLNEKMLLAVYEKCETKIDSMKFAQLLLFCRMVFDRFIVKSQDASDQEDGQMWVLIKPKKYDGSWKFVNSFDEKEKEDLVIKAVSMLQVTFRTKVYKQWLFNALAWFYDESNEMTDVQKITADGYLTFLNDYMMKYFEGQKFDFSNDPYSKGTATPHFLLNFIDYLYWCDFKKKKRGCISINDFDFKYWNSVEHHLARNNVPQNCSYIDNLGNLCLISKSSNSRLSDRDVKEKVEKSRGSNMGPNRQIIYAKTEGGEGKKKWDWGEKEITGHYNELVELIDRRKDILIQSCQEQKGE